MNEFLVEISDATECQLRTYLLDRTGGRYPKAVSRETLESLVLNHYVDALEARYAPVY